MLQIPQIWAVAAVIAEEEFRCLLRAEFISICPWPLLRRPPKLPLQIRTAVRLIIRPTAAVAATELFVSDKTADRKIRRILQLKNLAHFKREVRFLRLRTA